MIEGPTPEPVGSEVLVRVLAAGVCHSDVHLRDGFYDLGGGKRLWLTDRGVELPLTMGHETVGEVVAVGPQAQDVRIGDRRLAFPWIGCGVCDLCLTGEEQLCSKPGFLGVFRAGGYSDYLMVPHPRYLLDIGDLPASRAAPLACSGVTTFGALKKIGPPLARAPVVVIGAGGLGLMAVGLHRAMGGHSVIVADIDPRKREAAMEAGARLAVDAAAPDAAQQIVEATKGEVCAAIDLVGAVSTARLGMDCLTRKGGKLIIVGLFGGDITLSLPLIPMRALTVQGSYVGSLAEMRALLELVHQHGIPDVPITTLPLALADAALDDLKAGRLVGRAVLEPTG